jgi:Uma2 family endonuclease
MIPPLENGDRLSRAEFERRYAASPDVQKAELIEGRVFVASPLRFTPHAEPHSHLIGWLWTYKTWVGGVSLGIEPTVRLDEQNEPQPDGVLFRQKGNVQIDTDGYLVGAPELVVEIAASTASYDLYEKKRVYERHGVKEYIVWRTFDGEIDWFVLEKGRYVTLSPDDQGIIRSQEFRGLWLNSRALLAGNMPGVLQTLNEGIQLINFHG